MYTKLLLVVIILILSAFFYLHTQNPGAVTYVVTSDYTYTVPATLLVFAGFFAGVVVAVLNSLLVDAKRAIRDMRLRKDKKAVLQAEESFRKGMEALARGETVAARELFERASKAKPSDTGMIISLSETYVRENKPKEALKVLEAGLSSNPGSVDLLFAMAKRAEESGDRFRASKAYEDILGHDPKNPVALKKLREFRVAESRWEEAASLQKTIAEGELDEQLKKKERRLHTGLLYETAVDLVGQGRLAEAVAKVKEVLKSDDSFMPAHLLLGEILAKQGNTAGAIKVWEKAGHKYPHAEPLFLKLEDAYIRESAPDRILDKYRREILAHPNDTNLRLLLSRLYLRLEMIDDAIEELERLHIDGEDSFYPQVLLGEAYLKRKQTSKAAHLFQRALDTDRDFLPPFICTSCGHGAKNWDPRCPACGRWNTQQMKTASSVHKEKAAVVNAPAVAVKRNPVPERF